MENCDKVSAVSGFFSAVSLVSWMCAQLPQIYTNYRNKSAEAISPLFLLLWFLGDFLSFTSCLLNDVVLKFQIYLSLFFLANDIALCFQFYYYNSVYPKTHGVVGYDNEVSAVNSGALDDIEDGNFRIRHNLSPQRSAEPAFPLEHPISSRDSDSKSIDLQTSSVDSKWGGVWKSLATGSILNMGSSQALELSSDNATLESGFGHSLGLLLAWGCTFVYMGSRCPQLYKNYRTKSVDGISPFLFGSALVGNITYTLSILTSCRYILGTERSQFLLEELPYILGSSGTIIFDMAYFYQRHLYRGSRRNSQYLSLGSID